MLRSYYIVNSPVHYWLDDIKCNGDETSLLDCEHSPLGLHDCLSHERAGVACKSNGVESVIFLSCVYVQVMEL